MLEIAGIAFNWTIGIFVGCLAAVIVIGAVTFAVLGFWAAIIRRSRRAGLKKRAAEMTGAKVAGDSVRPFRRRSTDQ